MEYKSEFINLATHQGKDLYNIIKIEAESIDKDNASKIKGEFVQYFGNNLDKLLGGEQKNILDLSNVKFIDSAGISAILVLNRLNMTKYNNEKIKVINCNEKIIRLFQLVQINDLYRNIEEQPL